MAYKISNSGFFKKRSVETNDNDISEQHKERTETGNLSGNGTVRAEKLHLGEDVSQLVAECCKVLKYAGFPNIAAEVDTVQKRAERERFTIAVVGEFSRGKSTFINRLLSKDILPVGALPTTAVLTRIRYNQNEAIAAFDEKNRKAFNRPLSSDSWDELVAHNFGGNDFQGTVLVGIRSGWLDSGNIELIDTPGAGDLNEARVKVVGDALLGCDGAIIAVSALSPLSLSEKLFIEERLIARKLPFILLIITHLDMVEFEHRAGVIEYIINKLKNWNLNIPVYIPYQVDLGSSEYDDITGLDRIKNEIAKWIKCPDRAKLTEDWVLSKTSDAMKNAALSLMEQIKLLEAADEEKRAEMIEEKKDQLLKAKLVWGDLKLQMQQRCTDCYKLLLNKADEYAQSITERLQYEASHASNPQIWWTEDFPYRSKVELTNMAVGIENTVSRQISEDARWYSTAIEKTFHSYVLYKKETISDKELFENFNAGRKLEFGDLEKQRNAFKIGSAVLSISGFALLSTMGFMPIIATMGVGTGTAIISDKFFRKKIEQQKEEIKKEIASCIPQFIQNAMAESESRLTAVYNNIINEAEKSEQAWHESQLAAIEAIKNTEVKDNKDQYSALVNRLELIQQQSKKINMN